MMMICPCDDDGNCKNRVKQVIEYNATTSPHQLSSSKRFAIQLENPRTLIITPFPRRTMEIRALVDILMLLLVRTCFVSDNEDNRGVGHTGNKWIFNFYYFQCPGFICMIVTKMERKTLELSQHFLQ